MMASIIENKSLVLSRSALRHVDHFIREVFVELLADYLARNDIQMIAWKPFCILGSAKFTQQALRAKIWLRGVPGPYAAFTLEKSYSNIDEDRLTVSHVLPNTYVPSRGLWMWEKTFDTVFP